MVTSFTDDERAELIATLSRTADMVSNLYGVKDAVTSFIIPATRAPCRGGSL
jgi:hypothetical protein